MAAGVVVEMTSDEARLFKGMQKIIHQQGKMEQGFARTRNRGREAGKVISNAFDPMRLVKWAAGLASVHTALRLITAEIRQQHELQRKAELAQMTTAQARDKMLKNLGSMSRQEKATALLDAGQISRETGIQEKFIDTALADAVSAAGGDFTTAKAAVRQSAMFLSMQPNEISPFAGALVDVMSSLETRDAEVAQGFIQQIGAMSRVVKPQFQAKSIPVAVTGQVSHGARVEEAGAMFAALTTASKDATGERSASASVRLAEQLREFFEKKRLPQQGLEAQIGYLQQHGDLAKKFVNESSFEAGASGPIRELFINAQSELAVAFRENLKGLGTKADMARVAKESITDRYVDPLSYNADLSRRYKAVEDEMLVNDIFGAEGAINRQGVIDALKATGMGAVEEGIVQMVFDANTSIGTEESTTEALELLTRRADRLEHPFEIVRTPMAGMVAPMSGAANYLERPPTEQEMSNAEALRRFIAAIEAQTEAFREVQASVQPTTLAHPDEDK